MKYNNDPLTDTLVYFFLSSTNCSFVFSACSLLLFILVDVTLDSFNILIKLLSSNTLYPSFPTVPNNDSNIFFSNVANSLSLLAIDSIN